MDKNIALFVVNFWLHIEGGGRKIPKFHLQLNVLRVQRHLFGFASSILVIYRGCSYRLSLASCTLVKYSTLRVRVRSRAGVVARCVDIDLGSLG